MRPQERVEGRVVFGRDPAGYDRARPGIAAGFATGRLSSSSVLRRERRPDGWSSLGAKSLVLFEPNAASVGYLVEATGGAVEAVVAPF